MSNLPRIEKINDGFCFMVDNRPYIMLAGEVHNSACTSPQYMKAVWEKARLINCNTILAPIYWEFLEPQEGLFDFTIVQNLILEARSNHQRLVLLWFGSWKNGHSTYVPKWIKTDLDRFPRVENEYGVKSKTLSMFASDIYSVEEKFFKKLMSFIKDFDHEQHTVIAIQVENEVGVLGTRRDYSSGAVKAYDQGIPNDLVTYILSKNEDANSRNSFQCNEYAWTDVFGEKADEMFMCWNYASYIDRLAKNGKAIYNIPMFTNAWLKENENEAPGFYPCGGPVQDMIDVWKDAAKYLDAVCPDIYTFKFEQTAAKYSRRDNPLLIPETRRDKWAPANLYSAIGTYNTLCYSPFGLESIGENKSYITQIIHTDSSDKNVSSKLVEEFLSESYRILANMQPVITKYYGTEQMIGFVQNDGNMCKHIRFGKYQIKIEYYHQIDDDNVFIPAAGMIIQENENDLIFLGYGYRAYLETTNKGKQLDFLSLEKGEYDHSSNWVKYMDLNGDEQHIRMEEKPTILKALFYEF